MGKKEIDQNRKDINELKKDLMDKRDFIDILVSDANKSSQILNSNNKIYSFYRDIGLLGNSNRFTIVNIPTIQKNLDNYINKIETKFFEIEKEIEEKENRLLQREFIELQKKDLENSKISRDNQNKILNNTLLVYVALFAVGVSQLFITSINGNLNPLFVSLIGLFLFVLLGASFFFLFDKNNKIIKKKEKPKTLKQKAKLYFIIFLGFILIGFLLNLIYVIFSNNVNGEQEITINNFNTLEENIISLDNSISEIKNSQDAQYKKLSAILIKQVEINENIIKEIKNE